MAWRALAAAAALLGAFASARAVMEVGPEFQVNGYTTGAQSAPSVSMRVDGSFVVAWESGEAYGTDAQYDSVTGVFLQRFDAAGDPVGAEQHVNTFTIGDQHQVDVAAAGDGTFVVVWNSRCNFYSSPDECTAAEPYRGITMQRFDTAGQPMGGELIIADAETTSRRPAIAVAPAGEFVVAWSASRGYYSPPGPEGVVARRFTGDGMPLGSIVQVKGDPAYDADVTADPTGNFVVVWREYAETVDVRGRRIAANGTLLDEFVVDVDAGYYAGSPAVAAMPDGSFVVAWQAYEVGPRGDDVRARRFSADGLPLGPPFAVSTHVPGQQFNPSIAADPAGNFMIAWTSSDYPAGQDGDGSGIFAQAFAADGAALGSELQVNAFTAGYQNRPAVAAGPAGEFVIGWASDPRYGGPAQDGDDAGIFARRFSLRACTTSGDCEDSNPCTTDSCEDGLCLDRRQTGCCQSAAECWDDDPCTDDLCTDTSCTHPAIPDCVPCSRTIDCVAPDACTKAVCNRSQGRCEFAPIPECCLTAGDCNDGSACTVDDCGAGQTCTHELVPQCESCNADADCATGCLVGPETCVEHRCERTAGCPIIVIDDTEPLGAAGKLLVSVGIPDDVPGTGKIKLIATGRIGTLEPDDHPKRRCRNGKTVASVRTQIAPGTSNVLIELSKAGRRCLAADPDGVLPIDVNVRVKRKKVPLAELTEPRAWRR